MPTRSWVQLEKTPVTPGPNCATTWPRIVRWLHRGTAVVPWEDVREQVLPVSD